jgi:hypothetical protein
LTSFSRVLRRRRDIQFKAAHKFLQVSAWQHVSF